MTDQKSSTILPSSENIESTLHNKRISRIGIVWFIFTVLQSVLVNTMMRVLSEKYGYHPFQLVFFYSSMAAAMYLPSALKNPRRYIPGHKLVYCIRALLEVIGFSLIFFSLVNMPFAMMTVLTFVTPILGSFAAVWFLGESMTRRKWIGLGLGFIGILIVARPDASDVNWIILLPLGASVAFAGCVVCIRKLAQKEPPARIALGTLSLMALFSLPLAAGNWQMPELSHVPYLIVLAAQVAAVQFSVGMALQKISLTTAQPFMFLNLIWSSIIGYVLFDEIVEWETVLGAAIIICGIIYSVRHHTTRLDPVISKQPLP